MPYESEQGNGKQRERETRLSIIRAIRDHLRRDVEVGWNRQPPRPPSVAFSPWDSATNTLLAPRELVTGFQNEGGTRWGRSVTAVPGPDRSIYLTDDQAGLVYRLTPPA